MTYSTLKADIAAWLDRTDLTAVIPSFIRLAEAKIGRDVRVSALTSSATLTIAAGDSSVELPTDYAEGRSVTSATATRWASVARLFRQAAAGLGVNEYAIYGGEIHIASAATSDVVLTLSYYAKPAALSADDDTNWLLTNHPSLYLFGSLSEAAIYLGDDQRAALYEAKYQGGLTMLRVADAGESLFEASIEAGQVV